ncbi:sensor histidine kinase, partial [Alsobacter ponti]
MTLNRSVFAAIALGIMALHAPSSPEMAALLARTLPSFALFFFVTAAIFAHLLRHPGVSVGRRLFAMVHDFTMISWIAAAAGESAGLLYPLYLWTILGNGFRFGVRYIFTAGAIGLAGFSVVLWTTGFWALHPGLSAGLWLGLVVLPLYVSRLLRQLSQATHEAQQASRAKSAFLASVSHELRTPLNAVIGLSDLLAQQPLTRDQLGSVRLIRSAGQSLLELINTLLDFSRLEAGRMPLRKARFDVVEVAASLRAMMAPQAQEKGLALALQIAADAPRFVEADRKHVQEILFNLVGNALKFTRDGHVLLRLLAGPRKEGRAWLTIEVEDTGVGIAPEAQARIFESFAQADETILDRFGGTGLGLAICKQLAELMGGRISVRSTPGHGSTFAVELPVGVDAPEAEAAPATAPESARVVAAGADMGFAARLRAAHGDAGCAATPAELRTLLDGASGPSVVFLPRMSLLETFFNWDVLVATMP